MAASLRALRALRAGQQHVVGGVAAAIRRSRADLLRVQAGVGVQRLLVNQPGDFLPPVAKSPGLRLADVTIKSHFWWCRLYEDWHRYLVT